MIVVSEDCLDLLLIQVIKFFIVDLIFIFLVH